MTRTSFDMKIHQLALICCAGMGLILTTGCGGAGPSASAAAAAAAANKTSTAAAAAGRRSASSHAALNGLTQCTGTDVHQAHLSRFSCDACHPSGAAYGFTKPYVFPRGTSTAGGTIVLATGSAPTTCTVACHYPLGAPATSITWTTPGPLGCTDCHVATALPSAHPALSAGATSADCATCHTFGQHLSGTVTLVSHDAAWMDQASPTFHAVSAEKGLADCQQCHAQDLSGGATGVSCGSCHDQGLPSGVTWKTDCVMCHGGVDNQTGAPPKATWGNGGDPIRVGAHTAHVTSGAMSPAFDCAVCHPKPADALSANHIVGTTARMLFSGTAIADLTGSPAWDRTSATCSNTYCHGATLKGGTHTAPVWTGGSAEAACGTCHGLPPPAPHPTIASDLTLCAGCHGMSIDPTGALIPPGAGGKHLDGISESTGGHAPSWMDQTSPSFHAFSANSNISVCTSCHGADLMGGTAGVACTQCHVANWRTSCTNCHGGIDNQTGAPPRATWGNGGDPIRVGAHTAHLTGGGITQPIACATCHVVPTDALSPGHLDLPTATLTWSGLAVSGGVAPQWNRSVATCASTYCHGNYTGTYNYNTWDYSLDQPVPQTAKYTGALASPIWTSGPMTCSSCHGNPPQGVGNWHSPSHGGGSECDVCHPDAATNASGNVITDVTMHINGTVEVAPKWVPTCFYCH